MCVWVCVEKMHCMGHSLFLSLLKVEDNAKERNALDFNIVCPSGDVG